MTEQVRILNGNTFVVSDGRGDIEASATDPTGLFSFDTRYLSRWVLTVNNERLTALSTDDLQYFEARFFLVPGTGTVYIDAKQSIIRRRSVGNGFREALSILNHADEPIDLTVRMEAACDFADLFEVKDALKKKGSYATQVEDGRLVLGYRRETFARATVISSSEPCQMDQDGLTFQIHIEPSGTWKTDLDVTISFVGAGREDETSVLAWQSRRHAPDLAQGLQRWLDEAPGLNANGRPSGPATNAASWTSLPCGSLQSQPRATASPRRVCRGS
jgi:glycogen debranching enzyme